MKTTTILATLSIALAATAILPVADANHCGPVIVFGRVAQVQGQNAGANAGGVGCTALGEMAPDVRQITPGSPNLQVRWIPSAAGGGVPTGGTISGLGLSATLSFAPVGASYDSPYYAINPLATGDVTATVTSTTGTFTITFHKSA